MCWQCPSCLQTGRKLRSGSISSASVVVNDSQTQSGSSDILPDNLPRGVLDRLFLELSSIKGMQQSIVRDISLIRECQAQLSVDMNARCAQLHDDFVSCRTRLDDHDTLLRAHTDTIADMGSRLGQFEATLNGLSDGVTVRGDDQPGNSAAAPGDGSVDMNEVVAELMEQQKRARNVVLFGAEESRKTSALERKAADLEYVRNLFTTLGSSPTIQGVFRVGRFTQDGRRPLKVVLSSENDVRAVIQSTKKLRGIAQYEGVSVSHDRTPRQQEAYRRLRTELRRRVESGERDLKIRFVSGVPQIKRLN